MLYCQLTCITVDADTTNRGELTEFLAKHGVTMLAELDSVEALTGALRRGERPQLVVINLDPNPGDSLSRISDLPREFKDTTFVVMSQVVDPNLLMDAMHRGFREFIPLPISQERFTAALELATTQHGQTKRSKIINVIPTVGGCGSTTIACNVASGLANLGKTALVDLDLIRGGVASYFDIRPRFTIADVLGSQESIDQQMLDNALATDDASGLSILGRPELPEDTQRVTPAGMNRLMGILSRAYDYVVFDSLMSLEPIYQPLLAAADVNLVVMQLNVPSAKNAERFIGTLRRMGVESSKIRVVVNRYVKKGWDIEPGEVERSLGLQLNWFVPNDFKNAIASINYGQPVVLRAPRSEMAQSLVTLANSLSHDRKLAA